ncbi:MAG: hypothetical protein RBT59_08055 [Arcobacteraceae bacterium]|jgi:hypothetical protein|nr:hypothetical protein [Arcobacteraceae bacterium]
MFKITLSMLFFITFSFGGEYEEWLKTQKQSYTTYKKSMDDEFRDMLKKDWESYKTSFTPTPYKEPKPKEVPVIPKEVVVPKEVLKKSPTVEVKKIEEQPIIKEPIKVEVPKSVKVDERYKTLKVNFYNQNIELLIEKKYQFELQSITNETISQSWESLSKLDIASFILGIKKEKERLYLNDWALYLLLNEIGNELYHNQNKANIFTWFTLVKMGYDTKIGYSKEDVYLMSSVKQSLYQIAFFTMDGKKYYILTPNGRLNSVGSIYTYEANYPNATTALSFNMDGKALKIYTNEKEKDFTFSTNGTSYHIKGSFSKDLVDFYKTFPQSEYPLYFHSQKSPLIQSSLLSSLKPLVEGKSEIEAVNILLRFVQTAFAYKTDDEQFHYEKVFFPEETIYYPYSDCEDRSILFSYLVENLLGLDVVGLKFEDHLATAVQFSSKIDGDSFLFEGKRYTISDPTYINANAGMTMPNYKNKSFEVIK